MLRHWPWIALAYCLAALLLTIIYLLWRKRTAPLTARSFRHKLMVHLSESNESALAELTQPSLRMTCLGLDGLIYEARAFHCALKQEFNEARTWARKALDGAQIEEKSRLLFNMARWTALSGSASEARVLFRQLLKAHPRFMGAGVQLGVLLAQEEGTLPEALELFAYAEEEGLMGRDVVLLLEVAEAQLRASDPRWQKTLAYCEDLGATAEELERLRTLDDSG